MGKWDYSTVGEINNYKGKSINPLNTPETTYELYSVPSWDNNYPEIITGSEVGSTKQVVEKGDVLLCKINPRINRVWVVEQYTELPLIASSEWIIVRSKNVDSRFLEKYFQSPIFRDMMVSEQSGIGGSLTRAQPKRVSAYPVPLPPLLVQQQIADVLDRASALIEKRKAQIEKLDLLVKSQFIEMFVTAAEAKTWKTVTMQCVSTDMRTGPFGSALLHDEFVNEGIFVLGIDNAVENKFSYNRMRYITERKYQQLKRYTVKPLDVIITIMGTIGRSAVIPLDMPKAINTKHLACLTIDHNIANPFFISATFQTHPGIRQQLHAQTKGAIMDGLNLTIIKRLSFSLPPLTLQNDFAAFMEQVDAQKSLLQKSLIKLEQNYKSLMQKCFNGEVF